MWCLPRYLADIFLQKVADGSINPEAMLAMTSAQRREFFEDFMGKENAKQANTLLETKLILKDQKRGMVTWAKKVAGMTPEARRGVIARVDKLSEHLTPETEADFLEDLAAHAVGTTVTMEEMANIATMAKKVEESKVAMEEGPHRSTLGPPTKNEMTYGRSVVAFNNYVGALKDDAAKTTLTEKAQEYLRNPAAFVSDVIQGIASGSRELRTTLDNSFIGKQGRNLFFKGITGDFQAGKIWMDTFKKSFEVLYKTFSGQQVMDELNAEIFSDPQYDMIKKAGVAISNIEEETPTEWFGHLPYIGRPFAAAHNAFVGSAHYMRYKTAKYYFGIAEKTGVDLKDKDQLVGIGHLVNSLTGRGFIASRGEGPTLVDNAFFSRRMLKADWDVLTAHVFDKKATTFAKKEAGKNLLRIIAGQAMILAIANTIDPDSVEEDPRSADFGKIKIGNTRFDISGGIGSLTRLAVRLMPLLANKDASYKSTTTGKIVKINSGKFGQRTGLDIFEDFLENKASPIASIMLAHFAGEYPFEPDVKPSVAGDVQRLVTPLPIENIFELADDDESANIVMAAILDMMGVFTSTYGPPKRKGITIKKRGN